MTAAMVLGLVFGSGVLLIATGLHPARLPLQVALARLHEPRQVTPSAGTESPISGRLAAPIVQSAVGTAIVARYGKDMRILGTTVAEVTAKMALAALAGLIWAPAVVALMALGGVAVPGIVPAWGSIALGLGGAIVPLVGLRAEAAKRRRGFRHALSCYLDLVAIRLAGGAGVDSALTHSAATGEGWAFAEIRQALAEARLMGEPPWAALARLGEAIDVAELGELAASTALAGGEGARVRASLTAKARSIRTRAMAEAEANAESASERMSMPVVALMLGFIAFLGYPAVMQVLTGL